VVSLQERVDELTQRQRRARRETLGKVVSLEGSSHGLVRSQVEETLDAEVVQPFGVVADLRLVAVQNQEELIEDAPRIRVHLVLRQDLPGLRLLGRVADARGEVADDEHGLMAETLEVAE